MIIASTNINTRSEVNFNNIILTTFIAAAVVEVLYDLQNISKSTGFGPDGVRDTIPFFARHAYLYCDSVGLN